MLSRSIYVCDKTGFHFLLLMNNDSLCVYVYISAWPKSSFRVFHDILYKKLNKLFGHLYVCVCVCVCVCVYVCVCVCCFNFESCHLTELVH